MIHNSWEVLNWKFISSSPIVCHFRLGPSFRQKNFGLCGLSISTETQKASSNHNHGSKFPLNKDINRLLGSSLCLGFSKEKFVCHGSLDLKNDLLHLPVKTLEDHLVHFSEAIFGLQTQLDSSSILDTFLLGREQEQGTKNSSLGPFLLP